MCLEAHIFKETVLCGEVFHLERNIPDLVCFWRELICQFSADHQLDNVVYFKLSRGFCSYMGPVPHDGNCIGDPFYFAHFMRNINNSDSPVSEHIDYFEKVLDLLLCQGRCRLIKNYNFRII